MRMKKMRKRMMTREKRKQRKIQLGWKSRCKIAHPQPEPVKRPGGKRTRGTKLVPRGERPRRRYTLSSQRPELLFREHTHLGQSTFPPDDDGYLLGSVNPPCRQHDTGSWGFNTHGRDELRTLTGHHRPVIDTVVVIDVIGKAEAHQDNAMNEAVGSAQLHSFPWEGCSILLRGDS